MPTITGNAYDDASAPRVPRTLRDAHDLWDLSPVARAAFGTAGGPVQLRSRCGSGVVRPGGPVGLRRSTRPLLGVGATSGRRYGPRR